MSTFKCLCGYRISDGTDNFPYKGEVISDQDWETVWGAISELKESNVDERLDAITGIRIQHGRAIYECSSCGRLWLERAPGANVFVSYSSDSQKAEHVLRGKKRSG